MSCFSVFTVPDVSCVYDHSEIVRAKWFVLHALGCSWLTACYSTRLAQLTILRDNLSSDYGLVHTSAAMTPKHSHTRTGSVTTSGGGSQINKLFADKLIDNLLSFSQNKPPSCTLRQTALSTVPVGCCTSVTGRGYRQQLIVI